MEFIVTCYICSFDIIKDSLTVDVFSCFLYIKIPGPYIIYYVLIFILIISPKYPASQNFWVSLRQQETITRTCNTKVKFNTRTSKVDGSWRHVVDEFLILNEWECHFLIPSTGRHWFLITVVRSNESTKRGTSRTESNKRKDKV